MKKLILSAGLVATTSFCFAQWLPGTNPNDLYWNNGQVGIGSQSPTARLDVYLSSNFMYNDESGIRLTYPIPMLDPSVPPINKSLFEIRQSAAIGSGFSTKMVVKTNGNVGIGVSESDPLLDEERVVIADNSVSRIDLHVKGFSLVDGKDASLLLGRMTGAKYGEWGIEYNEYAGGLNFWKPAYATTGAGNYFLFISNEGNVSIGTENSKGYKFAVNGSMIAEKVRVKLFQDWPDFVFMQNYPLMSLNDLEIFIKQNSHLPNIPSADQVSKAGIDVASMDAALLQKIEELTLYVIELKKEIEALKK